MSDDTKSVGERAVELLVKHGYGPEEEFRGCSDEEIREIEAEFGETLPETYKSFMKKAGNYAGGFLRGHEYYYPAVKSLKEQAEKGLEGRDIEFELADTDFVFLGLQGYSYWFFNIQDGPDPAVFHYKEGDETPTKKGDSFSEWLFDEIQQ